jgi:hypothetical protein
MNFRNLLSIQIKVYRNIRLLQIRVYRLNPVGHLNLDRGCHRQGQDNRLGRLIR